MKDTSSNENIILFLIRFYFAYLCCCLKSNNPDFQDTTEAVIDANSIPTNFATVSSTESIDINLDNHQPSIPVC